MGFRLVPQSVTLNDLERRNGRLVYVTSPNAVAFGPYYAKVVEDNNNLRLLRLRQTAQPTMITTTACHAGQQ